MSTPQIRCNVCDSVLTVGWNTDDEGAYAYVDPCPKCSTTLRAQLAEANGIIASMCNDVENNYIYIKSFVDAKNYLGKVTTA